MRIAPLWILLVACKPDPAPSRTEPVASTSAVQPRRASLPLPTRSNALVIGVQLRAELAWTEASATNTAEAWDLAAELFERSRDACLRDCTDLAYSTVLARQNAIRADPTIVRPAELPTTPQDLPSRVEAFIDAADAYVAGAHPGDSDAVGVSFLAGQQYNNYGHVDESTTRFGNLVHGNPTHEVALYSANLLLDAFNRSERYDDLVRWARELAANTALMAAHAELAEVVAQILARADRAHGDPL